MDAKQMKGLLERLVQLKNRIKDSRRSIRRIKECSFEEYIEEKTYHSPLDDQRLQGVKLLNPTKELGIYGREQFERERDAQLHAEQYRLRERLALLWQMNSLIEQLDARCRIFIKRRYADGERVEDFHKELGVSRATAFRRIEEGIAQLVELYNEKFEPAA